MKRKGNEHSINNEPHRIERTHENPDILSHEPALHGQGRCFTGEEEIEHGVWDEPALRVGSALPDGKGMTYARWIQNKRDEVSVLKICLLTLGIALISGPLGIVGAVLSGGGMMSTIVFAPLTEEILKAATLTYVVEKKPYYIRSSVQIILVMWCSSFVFAFVENLLYLSVYISNPSPEIIWWRWNVCTLLHMAASSLAAIGLAIVWEKSMKNKQKPQLVDGYKWLIAAIVLHGSYNGFFTVASVFHFTV